MHRYERMHMNILSRDSDIYIWFHGWGNNWCVDFYLNIWMCQETITSLAPQGSGSKRMQTPAVPSERCMKCWNERAALDIIIYRFLIHGAEGCTNDKQSRMSNVSKMQHLYFNENLFMAMLRGDWTKLKDAGFFSSVEAQLFSKRYITCYFPITSSVA